MKKFLRFISNVELMGLVFFCNTILTYLFLKLSDESDFNYNVYYLSERFDYLVMSVIGYNIVNKKYHKLVLPAIAITLMRFINECLHITNIVQLNNQYLLTFEFLILLICLWRTSKTSY